LGGRGRREEADFYSTIAFSPVAAFTEDAKMKVLLSLKKKKTSKKAVCVCVCVCWLVGMTKKKVLDSESLLRVPRVQAHQFEDRTTVEQEPAH